MLAQEVSSGLVHLNGGWVSEGEVRKRDVCDEKKMQVSFNV